MEAKEDYFKSFITQQISISIPNFQRAYNWKKAQCKELFEDIIKAGEDEAIEDYFVGSIVFKINESPLLDTKKDINLVDGQQRITTLTLLICCICNLNEITEEEKKSLYNNFLVNNDSDKTRKLHLRERDDITLEKIVKSIYSEKKLKFDENDSVNVINTYETFRRFLKNEEYMPILMGINKLSFISIGLENQDEPQLIFESLNSTGRSLNNTDLIRNYILMDQDEQEHLYLDYWMFIEKGFKDKDRDFDDFIYYYLVIKLNNTVTKSKVYKMFKDYKNKNFNDDVEPLLQDLHKYAQYYFKIVFLEEEDPDLLEALKNFDNLYKNNLPYILLLKVYEDYENNDPNINLSKKDFVNIINLVSSYLLRQLICDTNSRRNIFVNLTREIRKDNYFNSFVANMVKYPKNDKKRFPQDDEFESSIIDGNISKLKKKLLEYIKLRTGVKNINSLDERKKLAEKMKKIWAYPEITDEIKELSNIIKYETGIFDQKIEDYKYLEEKTYTRELFDGLTTMIENYDKNIKQEFLKTYIAYKIKENVLVKIVGQKERLKIVVNSYIEELDDPKGICEDIRDVSSDPAGNTRIYLKNTNDTRVVFDIIKQVYNKI